MTSVKLIWITPEAEKLIGYCARVSNPDNQDNPDVSKLLKYCLDHKHVSIFEMANMCVEIVTSRDISAQIIRHKSFSFQEFSSRYSELKDCQLTNARRQDIKNRQNSIDDLDEETIKWWEDTYNEVTNLSFSYYKQALDKGIAKECARRLLPLSTTTKLYMNGSIRSFLTYLNVRLDKATQLEHREVAIKIADIMTRELPIITSAVNNYNKYSGNFM